MIRFMKSSVFMRALGFAILLTLPNITFAQNEAAEAMVIQNYLREQATQQLDQFLPRGKYVTQVSVLMAQPELGADSGFKLPMGTFPVHESDIPSGGTIDPLLMAKIMGRVKKVDIQVSVQSEVSPTVRDMIRSYLVTGLSLNPSRGDLVTINDLPKGVSEAWKQMAEATQIDVKTPILMMAGLILVCMILLVLVLMFAFNKLTSRISVDTQSLSKSIKEALENQMPASATSGVSPSAAAKANSPSFSEGGRDYWKRVDLETLTAFVLDCADHSHFASAGAEMINQILDSDQAKMLEEKLPANYLSIAHKTQVGDEDLRRQFTQNQTEYRRITKSPLGHGLLIVSAKQLLLEKDQLEKAEINLLINSLTPLKRGEFLKGLNASFKMELAQEAKRALSPLEHKAFEVSLLQKLEKFKNFSEPDERAPMSFLSGVILKPTSFAEDEEFFSQNQGSDIYDSALKAFEVLEPADWSDLKLDLLSYAFFGYSENVLKRLFAIFPGKQGGWLQNFILKRQREGLEFTHADVEFAQNAIKERIKQKANQDHKASA